MGEKQVRTALLKTNPIWDSNILDSAVMDGTPYLTALMHAALLLLLAANGLD